MAKKKDDDIMALKEVTPDRDVVIIFEPLCSVVEFDMELEEDVYFLQNAKLYDFENIDFKDINGMLDYQRMFHQEMIDFKKSGQPIMLMTFLPPLASGLMAMKDLWDYGKLPYSVNCIAFFHNDKDMEELNYPGVDDMIEFRDMMINSIEEFPFIKRFNIPTNFEISREYLNKLLREMV